MTCFALSCYNFLIMTPNMHTNNLLNSMLLSFRVCMLTFVPPSTYKHASLCFELLSIQSMLCCHCWKIVHLLPLSCWWPWAYVMHFSNVLDICILDFVA